MAASQKSKVFPVPFCCRLLVPFVVIILIGDSIKCEEEPYVDIDKYWGTVTIPAGKSGSEQEEFTCAATNVKKNGEFVWSIDGVKQTNSLTDYQDSSSKYETKLEHTFVIDLTKMSDPIAELNKKNLVCSYVQADDVKLNSDPLLLEVTIQDLPEGKVSVTNLIVGSPANLTVPMVVYPPPEKEDYTWVIQDNSTNTKIEVTPDVPNLAGSGYTAEINHVEGRQYEAVLKINNVTKEFTSSIIYMSAKQNTGETEGDEISSPKVYFDVALAKNEEEVSTMNLGIWIILAVIIVIIIICIVYCIYNGNCCMKKDEKQSPDPTDPNRPIYQSAPTKEVDNPPQQEIAKEDNPV